MSKQLDKQKHLAVTMGHLIAYVCVYAYVCLFLPVVKTNKDNARRVMNTLTAVANLE